MNMRFLRKVLVVSIILFFSRVVLAEELIHSLKFDAQVNQDGTVNITETILYDFGSEQRHGIFRNIPYKKVNQDEKSFIMDIEVTGINDERGKPYTYSKTKTDGELTIKIGDPNKTITGRHAYIINYTVGGALTYFDSFDEFYWNAVGSGWGIPINTVLANVNFEQGFGVGELDGVCYTSPIESTAAGCTVNKSADKISFETGLVKPGEAFTFAVKFPKGYAQILEPSPDKLSFLATLLLILLAVLAVSFYIALPLFLMLKWLKEKKHLKDNARIVSAWFSPPKAADGEILTPVETAITADVTAGDKAVPATIISLAQRGYIKITHKDKSEFIFSRGVNNDIESLRKYEKDLYKAIFPDDVSEVSAKELRKSERFGLAGVSLAPSAGEFLKKSGVFKSNPVNTSGAYTVLASVSLFVANIFLALVSIILGRKSPERPNNSIQTYSEAVSLKNFLVSQDPQFDFQAQEMMFFEKLLPFATAFGVEDVWLKRFKDLFNTNPDWYRGDDVTRLAVMNSVVNSSYRSASGSSGSSSGFSSGFSGGSSGGGGGGGGGGSW